MTRVLRPDVHPPPHPDILRRLERLEKGLVALASNGTTFMLSFGNTTFYFDSGAPSGSIGRDGDLYFRRDTPGTANQRIYVHSGGVWAGIL